MEMSGFPPPYTQVLTGFVINLLQFSYPCHSKYFPIYQAPPRLLWDRKY